MKRDELIKELKTKEWLSTDGEDSMWLDCPMVADYILQREAKLLDAVEKKFNKLKYGEGMSPAWDSAIDGCLSILNKELRGK
jgi:hypothetical protein